ncbi:Coenzyme Q (ubiquinone) biosynthesis protein Coq4 [Enhygromyxa salina]|uniref:Coenzyme Q (Ubiquinone) biosynthesis protein Coq4 n=1 Tax=Enhygromyxa salina TaxID=215803 RepID=A0A2S9XXL9_9BACT|nr:Coenzyme Q (ubiquinone) biosynthesis protein Coq4 [Enhygromyxa salina]
MWRSMLDSDETAELMIVEEISSIRSVERALALLRRSEEGRAMLAERPRISTSTVDFAALRELPEASLGRMFAEYIEREGIDPDLLTKAMTHGRSPEANYVLERTMQTHDLWHVVLGVGTQAHEEVLLHAFQWPQLRRPFSALILVVGAVKHLVGEGRFSALTRNVPAALRRGRAARPLLCVYWERHWDEPLDELRERLGVRPLLSLD